MAHGMNALLAEVRRIDWVTMPVASRRRRGDVLLAAVAGVFVLAQLLLVRPGMGLGWDETVYVSQVGTQAPPAFFSAPRARGVSLLVAPVASWSTSTELLRVYLAVLSGLGLYVGLRVWHGLFRYRVLAGAGALFATLWVTLFYGPQAMPNYWVAIGALVTVGCFLKGRVWGVLAGAALMAWMRPTDAVWVTVPLFVFAVAARRWRPLAALATGLALGAVQWVIEAYVSFGGLTERLDEASRIQGGLGWNIAVDDQMRSQVGRALCRPCDGSMPNPLITAWLYVLPVLAVLGLVVAVRAGRTTRTLVPFACAVTAAVPYLFMIGYAAPRFLLPAYALLALPVADALLHLAIRPNGTWRPVAATLVALGLTAHLAVQMNVLDRAVSNATAARDGWERTAAELHRLGVRPPCLLTGHEAIPVAYYTGCSSAATGGHNANSTTAEIHETARHIPVAYLTPPEGGTAGYAHDWTPHQAGGVLVRLAPPGAAGGGG
ncbi:hypothetical protein DI272_11625 [Streptomyces sp. Act143]|uniref:hypothetical protein n=1 Tax=Streptomyces sp. Act143 TaxID=2200760 RepID=UPI000D673B08|nr:hypothetical protein [Streptomyces sp. Act143]PWI14734.1 hypothetical protein DI272_11625 [Streptomyces sp. Act143]